MANCRKSCGSRLLEGSEAGEVLLASEQPEGGFGSDLSDWMSKFGVDFSNLDFDLDFGFDALGSALDAFDSSFDSSVDAGGDGEEGGFD